MKLSRLPALFLILVSVQLAGEAASYTTYTQYIAHYAKLAGWTTRLSIANPHAAIAHADIYAYDDAGNLCGQALNVTLPARGSYVAAIADIFALPVPDTGSLVLKIEEPGESLVPQISAIAVFEYAGGPSMGGLAAMPAPQRVLHFPWFQNSASFRTGIAILNVEPWDIEVVFRARNTGGNLRYNSQTFRLGHKERIIRYTSDLFTVTPPEYCNLSVYASGRVAGFSILHSSDYAKVEAINGIPIGQEIPDLAKDTVLVEDLGEGAVDIVQSAEGNALLIRGDDTSLYLYDLFSQAVTQQTTFAGWGGMDQRPDGKAIYVGDHYEDQIYQVDPGSIANKSVFASFTDPDEIACSTDGRFLAAANKSSVGLFDIDTGASVFNQPGFSRVSDIAFTMDSKYVLAVDRTLNKLWAHRIDGMVDNREIPLSAEPLSLAVHPVSGAIIIGHGTNVLTIVSYPEFTTSTLTAAASSTGFPALACSPDGRRVYAPCAADGKLYVLYPAGNRLVQPTTVAGHATCITVSPDGCNIYYVSDDSKLHQFR